MDRTAIRFYVDANARSLRVIKMEVSQLRATSKKSRTFVGRHWALRTFSAVRQTDHDSSDAVSVADMVSTYIIWLQ